MEFRAAGVAAPPAEGAGDSQVRRRRPTPAPSPGAAAALSCSSLGDGGRSPEIGNTLYLFRRKMLPKEVLLHGLS